MARSEARQRLLFSMGGGLLLITLMGFLLYQGSDWPRVAVKVSGLPVYGIAFSPDGGTLAARGFEKTIWLLDPGTGRLTMSLPESDAPPWFDVRSKPFLPDGIKLEPRDGESEYRVVRVLDATTGQPRFEVSHPDQVNSVAFSPDGRFLATAGGYRSHPWPVNRAGTAKLWEARSGRLIVTLTSFWGAVSDVKFSPDGSTLAASCYDGTVRLWNMASLVR